MLVKLFLLSVTFVPFTEAPIYCTCKYYTSWVSCFLMYMYVYMYVFMHTMYMYSNTVWLCGYRATHTHFASHQKKEKGWCERECVPIKITLNETVNRI